jgi:hypothetical protein
MRRLICSVVAVFWGVSLSAQVVPRELDSLSARLQKGDESVRRRIESMTRPLLISANERSLHGEMAHRVASIALILAEPISRLGLSA